jgi:hypothetical protein
VLTGQTGKSGHRGLNGYKLEMSVNNSQKEKINDENNKST